MFTHIQYICPVHIEILVGVSPVNCSCSDADFRWHWLLRELQVDLKPAGITCQHLFLPPSIVGVRSIVAWMQFGCTGADVHCLRLKIGLELK